MVTSFPRARSEAACSVFLWAVDPAEADAFRVLVVQDFDSVAVDNADDSAGEDEMKAGFVYAGFNQTGSSLLSGSSLCRAQPYAYRVRPRSARLHYATFNPTISTGEKALEYKM